MFKIFLVTVSFQAFLAKNLSATCNLVILSKRHGQPNWEYKMWKFQDFSDFPILCKIYFGHFEAVKFGILTFCAAVNFWVF